ncbi:MAG: DMT family transporter [Bacteroides sp.]|nr:DMT family transporter [Bacillota bacterium]MCM1393634.1 DMT family transporter [[Eubacterium] siraeum]MCM1454980.1 DMT family transporter [Bacteroides sp.]
MQTKRTLFGNTMLLLCALVWGFAFAFQRSSASVINPIAYNGLRFILASGVVFVFLVVYEIIGKKKGVKITPWNTSTFLGGAICGLSLFLASNLQQYGMIYTTAGRASFITALYIVLVPVFGLLARKKIGVFSRFAIPVAIAGFWLMCSSGDEGVGIGDLLGLASTAFFALQILFIDVFGKDSDPIKLTLVQFLVCSLISICGMGVVGFPSAETISNSIVSLLYVGVCSAGIGYTLQTAGQKYTEPSVAALIMSLESVVGIIGGVLILHEVHSAMELSGCVLVFVAVFLAQFTLPQKFLQFDKRQFAITAEIAQNDGLIAKIRR